MSVSLSKHGAAAGVPVEGVAQAFDAGADICLQDVTKTYGNVVALQGVNLRISPGSTVLCLGPNGAGKSTLLQVMAGLIRPSVGTVSLGGRPVGGRGHPADARVGVVAHKNMLYHRLTGRENLALHARLRGVDVDRIEDLLELVDLRSAAHRLAGEYSHGMCKRLALARSLLHDPQVLILDEPFSGLDPASQENLAQLVASLHNQRTVVLCTHDMTRAMELGQRMLIMHAGRIAWDRPKEAIGGGEGLMHAYYRVTGCGL